jgi:predicted MPP superfamily phosphohydrolase
MNRVVFMLFAAALIADVFIYFTTIAPRFRKLRIRVAYVVLALLVDLSALSAFTIYGMAGSMGPTGVKTVMWLVWVFFLLLAPKLLYCVGAVIDWLVRLVSRRKVTLFRRTGLVLAAATMAVMLYGATLGRTMTRVEHVEVCSPRVPAEFDGYRIVQFSDLHVGTLMNPERRIKRLAEKIAKLNPDMVAFTGDLVNLENTELTPEILAALGKITAPDGVLMSWGNHDLGFYIRPGSGLTYQSNFEALAQKIGSAGWNILSDRSTRINRGNSSIVVTGVDYPRDTALNSHNQSLAGVDITAAFAEVDNDPTDPFNVVLSHTPKFWPQIIEHGKGDLTLSGHVHSMQTKLRIGKFKWSPAQYIYKQWSGLYESTTDNKKSALYVNDGMGCVGYPMRIGTRGEITVITLKQCK